MTKAIFLDRDGTIIRDVGYISNPADIEFLPNVQQALRHLQAAGFVLITVSNQSGIGREWITLEQYEAVQMQMISLLAGAGIIIAGSYFCPHLPDAKCCCRKPRAGLLHQAASDLGIDLGTSIMIGDKTSDVCAGLTAGCRSILLNQSLPEPRPAVDEYPDWNSISRYLS